MTTSLPDGGGASPETVYLSADYTSDDAHAILAKRHGIEVADRLATRFWLDFIVPLGGVGETRAALSTIDAWVLALTKSPLGHR